MLKKPLKFYHTYRCYTVYYFIIISKYYKTRYNYLVFEKQMDTSFIFCFNTELKDDIYDRNLI